MMVLIVDSGLVDLLYIFECLLVQWCITPSTVVREVVRAAVRGIVRNARVGEGEVNRAQDNISCF